MAQTVKKKSACDAGDAILIPKVTWKRKWQPTPVFLFGEFHGQKSLVGGVRGVTKSRTQITLSLFTLRAISLVALGGNHPLPDFTEIPSLLGQGNGTPLQYSCLENPMDGGAW